MKKIVTLILFSILLMFLSSGTIGQETERISGEPTAWWWYDNASAEAIATALDQHHARLIDLEVTSVSPLRFSACMIGNTDIYASAWWWYFGISADQLSNLLDELTARIIDLEVYYVRGQPRFAAILVPNTGSQARTWWWYHGVSADALSHLATQNDAHLVDLEVLGQAGQQYAAVMIRNTASDDRLWSWHIGIGPDELSEVLTTNRVRILDLERMPDGRFAAILVRPQSTRWSWWWWYGLTDSGVKEVVNLTNGRVVDIERYATGATARYAAVLTGSIGAAAPGTPGSSAREIHPIRIVLTTTSDWTDIRFVGGTLVVHGQEVLEGERAAGLHVSALSTLSVSQACCDTQSIRVSFDAYVSAPAEWLQIQIDKGHIGQTTVALHVPGDPDPIATYTHTGVVENLDSGNVRTFSTRSASLISQLTRILTGPSVEDGRGTPKVLAFYYPWYGIPSGPSREWVHWNPRFAHHDSAHEPSAGWYDSLDPETVRRHIREAKDAGIDGFIASWWGPYGFEDRAFDVLARVAEEEGFTITIYYEEADTPAEVVSDLRRFLSKHDAHPTLLRVDDRPVVFFYGRVTARFGPEDWTGILNELEAAGRGIFAIADGLRTDFLDVFDGIHTYTPVGLLMEAVSAQYNAASLLAHARDRLFAATVLPGYDEAYRNPARTYVDRQDGETYRAYWAIARASMPDWILITSFNEWHEGTEIEPSIEFGRTYLDLTAEQATEWKAGEPVTAIEADRDGDGVPDEDDYCPDFPGSKEANGC